jgi:hypothetical protein
MKAITLVAVVCLAGLGASSGSMTNEQIGAAIAAGARGKNKHHGLILRDSAQSWAAALSAMDNKNPTASSGFWLEAFTPLSWIQQQAARAAKEYRTMKVDDVGDELREPVFRVIAHPDTPNTVSARGMTGTSSVQHVVLREDVARWRCSRSGRRHSPKR